MEIKGTVKFIGAEQIKSEKFKMRLLHLEIPSDFPQVIAVQFSQSKVDLLNPLKVGQVVEISINLRGREWTNPQGEVIVFNTIEGWKIVAEKSSGLDDDEDIFG